MLCGWSALPLPIMSLYPRADHSPADHRGGTSALYEAPPTNRRRSVYDAAAFLREVDMATFSEIEDLRDKYIDLCGELLKDLIDNLNTEEPADTLDKIKAEAEHMHQCGLKVIMGLDELLIQKKRVE